MIARRNLLLGLVAAPAIIRTAGLLMPVREIPDRYVIRLGAGEVLSDRVFNGPWRVELAGPAAKVIGCTFNGPYDEGPVVSMAPGANGCWLINNTLRGMRTVVIPRDASLVRVDFGGLNLWHANASAAPALPG